MTAPRAWDMLPPMRKAPFVTTLSAAALAGLLGACNKQAPEPNTLPPGNPPAPGPTEPEPGPPSAALPTWDEVRSTHPEGATNPPLPVLAVDSEGRCYKEWSDPRRVPPEVREQGYRALPAGEASTGTEVQCPPEAPTRGSP